MWGQILLMRLIAQLFSLPVKPPVTFALIVGQIALFFVPLRGLGIDQSCLLPAAMFGYGGALTLGHAVVRRLTMSLVTHANEFHLYYNMSSLLYKGSQLEAAMGSASFAVMVAVLSALTQAIYVALAFAFRGSTALPFLDSWNVCCVGFSGVLFALKVVKARSDPTSGWRHVFGLQVPVGWATWLELVVASLVNPRASFSAHLAGILAGYAWTLAIKPSMRAVEAGDGLPGLASDVFTFLSSLGVRTATGPAPAPADRGGGRSIMEADDEALARALQAEEDRAYRRRGL